MAGGMGRGGQVASFEALTQGDDLEANNPAPNGLALGNEQALCAYADRAVAVTQQAGGEAHTTGRDGRLRLQAYPLADPLSDCCAEGPGPQPMADSFDGFAAGKTGGLLSTGD